MPTPLPRPAATDYLDAPGRELDLLWDELCDVVEATEATANAAPVAAGVPGGQTLIGGTQAADRLTLQGSAASGTSGSAPAIRLLAGDAGAVEALTVLNNGAVGIGQPAPAYLWQVGSGSVTLAADGAGALASGGAPGTVETTTGVYAPTSLAATASSTANVGTAGINAIAGRMSGNPSTGTSSVYRGIYGYAEVPAVNTFGWGGSVRAGQFEVRCKGSGTPIGAQLGCFATAYLESAVTVTTNVALQGQAYNNAAGGTITSNIALYGIASNSAAGSVVDNQGVSALARNNSSGSLTTNIGGKYTASKTSSGSITTNIGVAIACTNSNASGSITDTIGLAIGATAAPWSNSGTITNATALLIGSSTNVGTNKKAIHSDSPAPSYLAGSLAIGLDAASAKLHSVATTEQLRLGYDATKYASLTVDSAGKLKIAAPLILTPPASITPASNGDLTIEATNNSSLTFMLKGSDGVVRSASLTLT